VIKEIVSDIKSFSVLFQKTLTGNAIL